MDAVKKLIEQPTWAFEFCYYFLAAAAIIAFYGIYTLFHIFTLPSIVQKFVPTTMVALSITLSVILSVVLAMMQFWICRAALAPVPVEKKQVPTVRPLIELQTVSEPDFAPIEGFRDTRRY
jgi:hypothetical protein